PQLPQATVQLAYAAAQAPLACDPLQQRGRAHAPQQQAAGIDRAATSRAEQARADPIRDAFGAMWAAYDRVHARLVVDEAGPLPEAQRFCVRAVEVLLRKRRRLVGVEQAEEELSAGPHGTDPSGRG